MSRDTWDHGTCYIGMTRGVSHSSSGTRERFAWDPQKRKASTSKALSKVSGSSNLSLDPVARITDYLAPCWVGRESLIPSRHCSHVAQPRSANETLAVWNLPHGRHLRTRPLLVLVFMVTLLIFFITQELGRKSKPSFPAPPAGTVSGSKPICTALR